MPAVGSKSGSAKGLPEPGHRLPGRQGSSRGVVSFRGAELVAYPGDGPVSPMAYVTLYANPSGLDASAQVVAGPVAVGGLVSGVLGTAQALFPGSAPVGADLWVGVRFSSDTAGLVVSEVPTIGTSHDLYREDGNLFYFGGTPVANFSIRVQMAGQVGGRNEPGPVLARLSTPWPNPMRSRSSVLMSLEETEPGGGFPSRACRDSALAVPC